MHLQINRPFVRLGLLLLLLALVAPAKAQQKTVPAGARAVTAPSAPINPQMSVLDVHNMTTWLQSDGFFPWEDPFSGVNGTIPKRTMGTVFAQGIVWGGKVKDGKTPEVRVNGSTYQTGLDPGRVLRDALGNVIGPDEMDPVKYHVWRVRRDWETLDYTQAASYFFGESANDVTDVQRQQIREQYQYDWNNWPAAWGAPYEDVDGNGVYDPAVDIPGYPGAVQTLWIVTNDLRQGTAERSYGSPGIGLEMQLTIWGYDFPSTNALGNIHFARARMIYTGMKDTPSDARIDSMFVAQWVDPDVGDAGDDFAGADTTLSLGYAYNANTRDSYYENFGIAPPAVGWDFLQGPISQAGDTLGMTAYVYFAAGSDISDPDLSEYAGSLQWYNLMRGMRPRPEYPAGDPFVDPTTGEPSKFTLTGNPVTGAGWIDGVQLPPGDRRIVMASGPFTMTLGDTVDVVLGQIGAVGTSNLSSVSLLKYYDQFAQYAYDNDFVLPSAPPSPTVSVAELDEEILLNWGFDQDAVAAVEGTSSRGFDFEGYNVYQLPSAASSLSDGVKIASFDIANLTSTIFDQVFDEETGFVIEKPVQISSNEGLQRFLSITRDHVRSRPLSNGVEYHYAVTAYSYLQSSDPDVPFRLLESSPSVITAVPQPPRPGATAGPDAGSEAEVAHQGASTAAIQVTQVDPSKLVTGDYTIEFGYYNPYSGTVTDELAEADTLREVPAGLFEATEWEASHQLTTGDAYPLRWRLVRDGQAVSGWYPQIDPAGSVPPSAAPIIEGLKVYVPYVLPGFATWDYSGTRWVTGVNWGGHQFFGGADIGANFFGSTLTLGELETVELDFQGGTGTPPEGGWASEGAVYLREAGYAHNGIAQLPFAAYAVDADGNRRQVNVSIVENTAACANGIWDMGLTTGDPACSELGGREYVFIHKSDYNGGVDYNDDNWGPAADVMYAIWPNQRGTHPYLEAPFTMEFIAAIATTPQDDFSFSVEAPATGQADLAEAAVEDINVFPNPYMGFSKLESSRYQKFVTFTHLPEQSTIRIFALNGTMVRRLDHAGPGQFARWDLTNQDNIPVASGVYLVHVDTPNGEKVLKLAVVQEEQVLEVY